METISSFEVWEQHAALVDRGDPLWRMKAYRLALYLVDVAWEDAFALERVRVTRPCGAQLYDAVVSVSANIAEGYSRSAGRDRARIFEYGLASCRESIVWYRAGLHILGETTYNARIALLTEIRKLLLAAIPAERSRDIRRTRQMSQQ